MVHRKAWLLTLAALAAGIGLCGRARAEPSIRANRLADVRYLQNSQAFQTNDLDESEKKQFDKVYQGPRFTLSHAWPRDPLPPMADMPWRKAIQNGPITKANAPDYAAALKEYVSANARELITHYDTWDAGKAGWYNEPWLGSQREPIHGAYDAGEFSPAFFPGTGLSGTFRTTVVTYYDERAAHTLRKVWGEDATDPALKMENFQFDEGSVIVKAAVFYSEDQNKDKQLGWWKAMEGAQVWQLYHEVGPQSANNNPLELAPGYVAQFDIIVKDSKSAPKTGWVFTTLVYDRSAPGADAWDRMVPLGAQWGNDPQAADPASNAPPAVQAASTAAGTTGSPAPWINPELQENWINPKAPPYSTETLGWGGRLSGPNDGARNAITIGSDLNNPTLNGNAADSSCMSCHSTAQWNPKAKQMDSFLLPSFPTYDNTRYASGFYTCANYGQVFEAGPTDTANICSPEPGSAVWMAWFQNRLGTKPMDATSIATDFDEVFSFKTLPMWAAWAASNAQGTTAASPRAAAQVAGKASNPDDVVPRLVIKRRGMGTNFNLYNGAPLAAELVAR